MCENPNKSLSYGFATKMCKILPNQSFETRISTCEHHTEAHNTTPNVETHDCIQLHRPTQSQPSTAAATHLHIKSLPQQLTSAQLANAAAITHKQRQQQHPTQRRSA
jgi:hypothetical protein